MTLEPDAEGREAAMVAAAVVPGFVPTVIERYSTPRRRSNVYRVTDCATTASLAVKLQPENSASLEDRVYRTILPTLTVSQIRGHGIRPASTPGWSWLVTDHAHGASFDPAQPDHLASISRWLGRMHTEAAGRDSVQDLPQRDASYWRGCLADAITVLDGGIGNPELSQPEVRPLVSMAAMFQEALDQWRGVTALLSQTPTTLVHGDITAGNVRLAGQAGALDLLAFDWETAGGGSPMIDLPNVDLGAYLGVVSHSWPWLDLTTLSRMRTLGTLAWTAYVLTGERSNLASPWPHRAAAKIPEYLARFNSSRLATLVDAPEAM